jgi:GDPmannose 4,6-dehydratase
VQKTAIITGITGQDGAYLSQLLLGKGYRVVGLTRSDAEETYFGLSYLKILDQIVLEKCSLLDTENIQKIFLRYKPDEVYNLAAQSSVGASFKNPYETINFNILSVLNLLEVIKKTGGKARFYQASSSDMFGNIDILPVTEKSLLHPTSPYAISKITGHQMTISYRESYGLFACSGILFNHESYLRGRDFFVKKVIRTAIDIKEGRRNELQVGNIDLERDFGYAPDYVMAMWLMLQQEKPKDYLVCSGQSVSLREIIYYVFDKLGIDKKNVVTDSTLLRPNDIRKIFGDNRKAKEELGWVYNKSFFDVLDILIGEELANEGATIGK